MMRKRNIFYLIILLVVIICILTVFIATRMEIWIPRSRAEDYYNSFKDKLNSINDTNPPSDGIYMYLKLNGTEYFAVNADNKFVAGERTDKSVKYYYNDNVYTTYLSDDLKEKKSYNTQEKYSEVYNNILDKSKILLNNCLTDYSGRKIIKAPSPVFTFPGDYVIYFDVNDQVNDIFNTRQSRGGYIAINGKEEYKKALVFNIVPDASNSKDDGLFVSFGKSEVLLNDNLPGWGECFIDE